MNQFSFSALGSGGLLGGLVASSAAARVCTAALALALAGLATSTVLKIQYGAPAPAMAAPQPSLPTSAAPSPVPSWLAGAASAGSTIGALKLIGVVAQGKSGYALVQDTQDPSKRPQIWRVGQRQANGSVLTGVQGKSATFTLNGLAQTLTIDSGASAASPALAAAPVPYAGAAYTPPPAPVVMPNVTSPAAMMQQQAAAEAAQSAQQLQQIQLLQQAASNDTGTAPSSGAEQPATAMSSLKKRVLGGRP